VLRHALLAFPLAAAALTFAPAAVAEDLGPATVVGKVTNTSGRVKDRKIFVQAGRQKWALHVPDEARIVHARNEVSVHDIDVGTYVKAVGKRIGRLRLEPDDVMIIGDRLAFRKSKAYRRDQPEGYFVARRLR
jgi:accessory colonization factor AcfC